MIKQKVVGGLKYFVILLGDCVGCMARFSIVALGLIMALGNKKIKHDSSIAFDPVDDSLGCVVNVGILLLFWGSPFIVTD